MMSALVSVAVLEIFIALCGFYAGYLIGARQLREPQGSYSWCGGHLCNCKIKRSSLRARKAALGGNEK